MPLEVGGFKLYVEDRASLGFEELYAQVQAALAELERLLGSHIGVLSIGEVKVLRPDRF